jgi:hypothetical protein
MARGNISASRTGIIKTGIHVLFSENIYIRILDAFERLK